MSGLCFLVCGEKREREIHNNLVGWFIVGYVSVLRINNSELLHRKEVIMFNPKIN